MKTIDIINLSTTGFIAVTNFIWTLYVYIKTKRQNGYKTLILDNNIHYLYDYFSNIENETEKLKSIKELTAVDNITQIKNGVNTKILQYSKQLEQRFIDLFLLIDRPIYLSLKTEIDRLTDTLTEAIFDEGINIYVEKIFDERITSNICTQKAKIIKLLMQTCN